MLHSLKILACLFHANSWVKENKLNQLGFARQKLAYCYLSTVATLFPPEMSDARMCWVKNSVLTTVVDDFFDVGGSREELLNIISLVEKYVLCSCGRLPATMLVDKYDLSGFFYLNL